jgi:hypothetical protein
MNPRPLLLLAALAAATEPDGGGIATMKEALRRRFAGDPLGVTVGTVLTASALFFKAEHGHNPRVRSFYDALVYVSTNISVGYCDIFAVTPLGKLIGSALMTIGPAMATRALDAPVASAPNAPSAASAAESDATARAILERLDRIVAALEVRGSTVTTVADT